MLGGKIHAGQALLALCCSSPGAYASLLLGLRARSLPPEKRVVLIAAGSVIRLFAALLLSALAWCVILSEPTPGFWIWVVIGYGLTLTVDVWLMLRVIQATSES